MRLGTKFGTRHFNLQKQIDFISGHGALCLVTPTLTCPCVTVEVQFDPLCSTCNGTGRFPQTTQAFQTTLLLTRHETDDKDSEPGSWVSGMIQATTLPGLQLAHQWFVRVLDMQLPFSDEVLVRGRLDSVRFQGNVTLQQVRDRDTVYQDTLDYTFTPPSTITWLMGEGPPLGAPYSVFYTAQPEYLVFLHQPKVRVEHRVNQAQVVQLMRLDMLHRDGLLAPG